MSNIAINVENLSKSYRIKGVHAPYTTLRDTLGDVAKSSLRGIRAAWRRSGQGASRRDETFWALKDLSFQVAHGEIVGIVGGNGAGKTTLLKILSRITEPTRGFADVHGRLGSLLEVGTGFHRELTGRDNIYLNGAILGMKRAEINRKFDEIVDFADVHRFIDTPVKHFSSGMQMRLAFSIAAHLEPQILLVDEVLAVGDVVFQQKCLGKMEDVAGQGRTVLLVSHNMGAIRSLCKKGIFLNAGRLEHIGEVQHSIEAYYAAIGCLQSESDHNGRSCFGPIEINGRRGNTVLQSDGFSLGTTIQLPDQVNGFTLYCRVEDMHGRSILDLRQDSSSLAFEPKLQAQLAVNVRMPSLWLTPGLYTVQFQAHFPGRFGQSTRYCSDSFPLDVNGIHGRTDTLLNPKVNWELTGQAERLRA